MGSNQSKQSKKSTNEGAASPNKHGSADSSTPLTPGAAAVTVANPSGTDMARRHATWSSCDAYNTESPAPAPVHNPGLMTSPHAQAPALAPPVPIHVTEGHADVTRPPAPPHLRRLSELIDPADLDANSHVRSPSGNILGLESFLAHPDRPRSIRERQQRIQAGVRAASHWAVYVDTPNGGEVRRVELTEVPKKKKRTCFSCFGR